MKRKAVRRHLIDLGAATQETKGAWGVLSDEVLMHNMPGLAKD